jgi:hypothetical protein
MFHLVFHLRDKPYKLSVALTCIIKLQELFLQSNNQLLLLGEPRQALQVLK